MNHTFIINKLISDIILIKTQIYEDHRGTLYETYNKELFVKNGIPEIAQEKSSFSKYKVLRGLHYQKEPHGQGKIIRCNKGKIFDVAVDMRENSNTYKQWVSYTLSEENKTAKFVGFQIFFLNSIPKSGEKKILNNFYLVNFVKK